MQTEPDDRGTSQTSIRHHRGLSMKSMRLLHSHQRRRCAMSDLGIRPGSRSRSRRWLVGPPSHHGSGASAGYAAGRSPARWFRAKPPSPHQWWAVATRASSAAAGPPGPVGSPAAVPLTLAVGEPVEVVPPPIVHCPVLELTARHVAFCSGSRFQSTEFDRLSAPVPVGLRLGDPNTRPPLHSTVC